MDSDRQDYAVVAFVDARRRTVITWPRVSWIALGSQVEFWIVVNVRCQAVLTWTEGLFEPATATTIGFTKAPREIEIALLDLLAFQGSNRSHLNVQTGYGHSFSESQDGIKGFRSALESPNLPLRVAREFLSQCGRYNLEIERLTVISADIPGDHKFSIAAYHESVSGSLIDDDDPYLVVR